MLRIYILKKSALFLLSQYQELWSTQLPFLTVLSVYTFKHFYTELPTLRFNRFFILTFVAISSFLFYCNREAKKLTVQNKKTNIKNNTVFAYLWLCTRYQFVHILELSIYFFIWFDRKKKNTHYHFLFSPRKTNQVLSGFFNSWEINLKGEIILNIWKYNR